MGFSTKLVHNYDSMVVCAAEAELNKKIISIMIVNRRTWLSRYMYLCYCLIEN